ncbi:unnamed protein product [Paramecium octaurelia]|uniref:Ubiquitin-like protease family profile domain-containing protein n=1 Tax=Paramecium octaurelia TaxID=43137 RepID=A0A8S1WWI1_PAROT|nr:unnamed protein product [Paramecium octaurelia]
MDQTQYKMKRSKMLHNLTSSLAKFEQQVLFDKFQPTFILQICLLKVQSISKKMYIFRYCCCCCFGGRPNKIDPDRPQKPSNSEKINPKYYQDVENNNGVNDNRAHIKNNEHNQKPRNCTYYQDFDRVEIETEKYDKLIIFTNILFYYCEKSSTVNQSKPNDLNCDGELYMTKYDQDTNPKFEFAQGKFQVDLEQKKFNLILPPIKQSHGIMKEFEEQSNNLMNDQNNGFQENRKMEIKIFDANTNKQLNKHHSGNNQYLRNQNQKLQQFCKFNQILTTDDVNILSEKRWMTSSIIDSYVLYLNKSGEEHYFNLTMDERSSIRRILFFPSSLTTNFGTEFNLQKVRDLFEQEKPQFKQINFKLSLLYHYVGFPINNNNTHWLFLLFNLNSEKVFVFDSMPNKKLSFKEEIGLIAQILNVEHPELIEHQHSGQQKDSYSCGYRVCSLMGFYYDNQFKKEDAANYKYNEQKIIDKLKTLIKVP